MTSSPELFDGQAHKFDRRAGLDEIHCRLIATTVLARGDARAHDLVIEIGAGTGQIGAWLAAAARYLGVDLSREMLRHFRTRLQHPTSSCLLLRADANRGWPLVSGAARVIFGSRVLHLLNHEHVADEVFRIADPAGATLIIGRVERPHDSLRSRLAREMRHRLRAAGLEPRGDRQHRRLIDACVDRGAALGEPVTTTTWPITACARQSLDAWRQLPGLGGVEVPDAVRARVLVELEAWADDEFGGLDEFRPSNEEYVLRPLRITPVQHAGKVRDEHS